ncbi:MAG: methyltransferase domain-containing protein [Myxococcota bacterium]|nr:methyltransferase domain-containing protein [Myxococcota bacterium]
MSGARERSAGFDPAEGFSPRLYQALHIGNPGDLEFYLTRCRDVGRVLELGAGAGRLSCPLAAAGALVHALELSAEMIREGEGAWAALQAQDRAPLGELTWVLGDMRRFSLGLRFERILIPYNSLYCLPDRAAQRDCLAAARAHLAPAGELLIDGYQLPDPALYDFVSDEDFEPIGEIWVDGEEVLVEELDEHEQSRQRCTIHYRHRWRDGRQEGYALQHRYLSAAQIDALLQEVGLQRVHRFGDFPDKAWSPDAPRWVVTARRASDGGSTAS